MFGMPLNRRRRRLVPLSALAVGTATITFAALIPSAAAAAPPAARPTASTHTAPPSPSPSGVTRAPASNAIGVPGADRPLVEPDAFAAGFQGLGIGQVPWSQFWQAQPSDSVSAQVNLGNGNLLVSVAAFDIADAGPGLSLGNAYNGLNTSWKATTGSDYLIHEATPDDVYVQGPSSTIAVFGRSGSGFTPAPGYKQDLTEASDKKSFTLTSRGNGQKTTFTRAGTTGDARVSKVEDKNGNATTVSYSGAFTSKITSTSGRTLTFTNDGAHVTKVADNTGRSVGYGYTGADLTSFTDSAGKKTLFGYDTSHRLTKITTPRGNVTTFTWDTVRVASVTRVIDKAAGTGNTTAFRWVLPQPGSEGEGVVRITDPRGKNTLKTVDARWRVTKTEDPLGHTRSKTWGPDNNVTSAVDGMGSGTADGNTVKFEYDDAFNPTTATQPTGARSTMNWVQKSGGYYPDTMTSASSQQAANAYDTSGNVLSQKDSTSGGTAASWDYTYNPKSGTMTCGGKPGQRCTATDSRGKKTSFGYDAKGDLTTITPPGPQKPLTYTYDDLGRARTVKDGRGIVTTYGYDDRDRVVSQQAGSATAEFGYDDDGNIVSRRTPAGTTTVTYDEQNRERTRTLPGTATTSVTYDPTGNVASAADPSGTTVYGYDDANALTSLTEPGGAKTAYEYDKNGKRTKTTYPGGTTQSVTLDKSSRPTKIVAANGSTTFSTISYDYAQSGKDTDKVRTRTADGAATAYSYDTQGRLTKAVETKAGATTAGWSYCYDKAGNRTGSSTGTTLPAGCDSAQVDYAYDDAGELTSRDGDSGFGYDGAGNETSAASPTGVRTGGSWSPFSQLGGFTDDGAATVNTYAGVDNNHRLSSDGTTFVNTAVGLSGQSAAGAATGFVREPSGTLTAIKTGGASQYYLTDAQGSVIGLVDASGRRTATYSYGPYGEARTNSGPAGQPYRYTGSYLDPSGLYKMGARYYDPALGRFTQPDPSGKEANLYAYANGDPVNRADPSGLFSWSKLGKGLAKEVGGAFDAEAVLGIATELGQGHYVKAAAAAAGTVAGAITDATCISAAAAVSLPTAGVGGAVVGLGCGFAGDFVGSQVESAAEESWS
ncbi:RHS repeat-associated core domain-containing protein [Streptomyces sp. AcH 505]|uniref:RHS repeat-associated core domain-containing protein n=1 Tax=Streptomyces sp. AcH 505 TaxID=352211 RepID=UPI000694E87E